MSELRRLSYKPFWINIQFACPPYRVWNMESKNNNVWIFSVYSREISCFFTLTMGSIECRRLHKHIVLLWIILIKRFSSQLFRHNEDHRLVVQKFEFITWFWGVGASSTVFLLGKSPRKYFLDNLVKTQISIEVSGHGLLSSGNILFLPYGHAGYWTGFVAWHLRVTTNESLAHVVTLIWEWRYHGALCQSH